MKFNKDQCYRVSVLSTEKFIVIESYALLGVSIVDPLFPPKLLEPDVEDQTLGETILLALGNSRTITDEKEGDNLCNPERREQDYKEWKIMLRKKYGYKTQKALFQNMKSCSIKIINGIITITPSHHKTLESWSQSGIKEEDYVILSVDNTPAEIGAGLRLALTRCITSCKGDVT